MLYNNYVCVQVGAKGAVEWEDSQMVKLRMKEFPKLIRAGGREFQAGEIALTTQRKNMSSWLNLDMLWIEVRFSLVCFLYVHDLQNFYCENCQ